MLDRMDSLPGHLVAGVCLMYAAILGGCPNQDLAPLSPCTVSAVSADVPVSGVDKVDLLFVIDDSGSMVEEQKKLAAQLPKLVGILTSGMKDNGETFPPVKDLHLGVVTSDMGGAGIKIGETKCDTNGINTFGRDGILLDRSAGAEGACEGVMPGAHYLSYVPKKSGGPSADEIAESFKCLANVGTNGCGFEQQLEAMYKALAPDSVSFAAGTKGHGNRENKGFLRSDAVLAVIHVSDEEDCSVTDEGRTLFVSGSDNPNVFGPNNERLNLNIRCAYRQDKSDSQSRAEKKGLIHDVDRYVSGLKALKPDNDDRIVFAAIVGIPSGTENQGPEEILAHPKMAYSATADGKDVVPACENPETNAKPAVRFVKTAQGFGDNGVVQSICADTFAPAVNVIIEKISKQLKGGCLPRPLARNDEGIVECDVVEILPPGASEKNCSLARGRKFKEMREIGSVKRVVCDLQQVGVLDEQFVPSPRPIAGVDPRTGWFYDDFSERATKDCPKDQLQRISFNGDDAEPQESTIRFECVQSVASSDGLAFGKAAVDLPCEDEKTCKDRSSDYALSCAPSSNTCQIPCSQDSECPPAWVCGPVEASSAQNTKKAQAFCVNPTCPAPTVR